MAQASDFDFVIVGAGSAGSVLAERLSANPRQRVLLIEEGRSDQGWIGRMPTGFGKLMSDPEAAHHYPVEHNDARWPTGMWVRGKMLGGSSGINGMMWNRGVAEDYHALEARGNPGWGWQTMLRCLRALEDHEMGESDMRGVGGPIAVTRAPQARLTDAFIEAGTQYGLAVKDDMNARELAGVGYAQWNIDRRGRRVGTAHSFLKRAKGRPNLAIETGVRVDRVVIENGRAVGVAGMRDGQAVEFRASGEVLLSAGTLVSPRILQLSGIGDAATLNALGIPMVHHSPHVGGRMREHLSLGINYRLRDWRDSDNRAFGGARLLGNVLRYAVGARGPMSYGVAQSMAFLKADPASSRTDTQILMLPWSIDDTKPGISFEPEPGMQCCTYILRPDSEGSVALTSADPAAPQRIKSNHLATEHDRRVTVAGLRAMRAIMDQPALKPLVIGETARSREAQSDDDILDLYRQYGTCSYHAVGTVAMGPNADDAIDPQLRVRGVDALRVIDCSIFPEIPAGNTNAPTMAAALHAVELIGRN